MAREIFLVAVIEDATPSVAELDLTEGELGWTPTAARQAWGPAGVEATEEVEDSEAEEVVAEVVAADGADN